MVRPYLFITATCLFIICCKKDNNRAPVANAGIDQIITLPVNFVDLDGSRSSDPDNNITSYRWTKISGPASYTISDRFASKPKVTSLVSGVYLFELKVTDASSAYAIDIVQIEVKRPIVSLPPVADAGPDQSILLPATRVIIDGSKSADPNNLLLIYKWKKIAGPEHIQYSASFYQNPHPAKIEMNLNGAGEYLFELTVTNGDGLTASDVVKISVVNSPPTAHPIDMIFSINPFCVISGSYPSPVYYGEAYFSLVVASPSGVSVGNLSADARIDQSYERYATDYFSPPALKLQEGNSGLINFQFKSDPNFFTILYNGSSANFADSVFVISGMGQFANVIPGTGLYCTGTANITHHTGSIRLQGTIYY